ncbi:MULTISPECIES: YARHG domain-containing protein [unclassified Dysgonomonas]|uniref:YARHG domain-containing protein n=1 Tax=unclassified Dysgonomonas TaxID=2630389 RepID=UPI0038B27FF4
MSSTGIFSQEYDLDKTVLSKNVIKEKCDRELLIIRNEIYARHGYVFSNEMLSDYFNSQHWYKPIADNKQIKLNKTEEENIALISIEEGSRKDKYKAIDNYF